MKIVSLAAENFKRLKAVEITPRGNTVVVSGANAQGKSSVLDAIWAALGGKAGAVEQPIRQGERKASVRLDLGDMIVTRQWKGARSELVVESASGARFPSPQSVLDELISRFAFDPLAFANADAKKQAEILAQVVGLDLKALANERKGLYDERTEVNRDVKSATAQLEALPQIPIDTPDEPVDVSAAAEKMSFIRSGLGQKQALLAEHARLTAELERVLEEGRRITAMLPPEPEAVLAQLEATVRNASTINENVRVKRETMRLFDEHAQAQGRSDALTELLNRHDEAKRQAIANAALPVDGLGLDDDGVTLNGVPFSQASAAERLRTSVAIGMSMTKPDGVRVITIRDGSLLDSANMALIEQMAVENDCQIWVEKVDESGSVGVVIEDGVAITDGTVAP